MRARTGDPSRPRPSRRRLVRAWWRWAREVRPTLGLAFPIMSGMVGQMLMGLADTIMVGRVGVIPLAAASFVLTLFHLPMVFGIGLLSAVSMRAAQAFGAGQNEVAGEVLRHGLVLSLGTSTLLTLGLMVLRLFLSGFGQPPEVVAASGTFLWLLGGSLVPLLVAYATKQFSEALSQPWGPSLIMLGGVLLNILLNWVLIYGHWGAPALGLEGAGWATLVARTAVALGMILFVVWTPRLRAFQPRRWWAPLSRSRIRDLGTLGGPVAVQHLLEVSAFSLAALMMGWIGAEALAAHQVAITCATTTFMFPLGLGLAVCIRVGQAWGSGQHARMRRIGFVGLGLAVSFMLVFAILFITAGVPIARLFVESPGVVRLAAQLLWVAALFQVADGLQVVALSALRGLTDVRVPALVAVLAYWMVAVPTSYALAFPAGRGALGVWIGLALGLGVAAATLCWRFHRKTIPPHFSVGNAARHRIVSRNLI